MVVSVLHCDPSTHMKKMSWAIAIVDSPFIRLFRPTATHPNWGQTQSYHSAVATYDVKYFAQEYLVVASSDYSVDRSPRAFHSVLRYHDGAPFLDLSAYCFRLSVHIAVKVYSLPLLRYQLIPLCSLSYSLASQSQGGRDSKVVPDATHVFLHALH